MNMASPEPTYTREVAAPLEGDVPVCDQRSTLPIQRNICDRATIARSAERIPASTKRVALSVEASGCAGSDEPLFAHQSLTRRASNRVDFRVT
jgi:hypothetical protein